jgi:diguanylate cyclase (GGDEF)-like protein
MAVVQLEAHAPLQVLANTLRENAWELALEAVEDGLSNGAVPRLADLEPLERVGDIPAFIGELAREIADPQPARFHVTSPLLELARAHAANREAHGFAPREVLTEFLLLRRVLWRALSRERRVLEASDPLLVQERLDSAFDTLVVEFSVAFFDRATEALAEQARSDALTGLLNHQAFWGDVTRELQRAQRYGHGIALIYFDIDHFKQINDTHGHPVGDRVLRGVADILALELRESDLVGRTGGDEFAACLVHSDVDVGPLFIPRLRSRVAELSGEPGMPPVLSMSAGCAHFPTEAGNAEALFELADARLYEAKRARNA